jgi:hypothetical protein
MELFWFHQPSIQSRTFRNHDSLIQLPHSFSREAERPINRAEDQLALDDTAAHLHRYTPAQTAQIQLDHHLQENHKCHGASNSFTLGCR